MTIDELSLRKDVTDAERPFLTTDPSALEMLHARLLEEAGIDEDYADRIVKWVRRKAEGLEDTRPATTRSRYRRILASLAPPQRTGARRRRSQRGVSTAQTLTLLALMLALSGVRVPRQTPIILVLASDADLALIVRALVVLEVLDELLGEDDLGGTVVPLRSVRQVANHSYDQAVVAVEGNVACLGDRRRRPRAKAA